MLGRDIFSRLVWGARTVVVYSTLATLTAYAFGLFFGLIAGYAGGRTDATLSFLANVVLSFPVLVLYIVIIVMIGASPVNIVIAVTFSSAPAIFRIVRGITIDVASRDFVKSAITQGESTLRILFVDILPNTTGPLAVDFASGSAIRRSPSALLVSLALACLHRRPIGAGWSTRAAPWPSPSRISSYSPVSPFRP